MKKLSNKGQSLVLFVVFLPIVIFVFIYVINIYYISYIKNKINSINYNIVSYTINNLDSNINEKTKQLLKENNIKEDEYNLSISLKDKRVSLIISKKNKFFYNNIIKIDNFIIQSKYNAKIIDDEVKIERVR